MIDLEKYGFKNVLKEDDGDVFVFPNRNLRVLRNGDRYSFRSDIDENSSILHAIWCDLEHMMILSLSLEP